MTLIALIPPLWFRTMDPIIETSSGAVDGD